MKLLRLFCDVCAQLCTIEHEYFLNLKDQLLFFFIYKIIYSMDSTYAILVQLISNFVTSIPFIFVNRSPVLQFQSSKQKSG